MPSERQHEPKACQFLCAAEGNLSVSLGCSYPSLTLYRGVSSKRAEAAVTLVDISHWRSARAGAWFSGWDQACAEQSSFKAGFSPLLLSTSLGWRNCSVLLAEDQGRVQCCYPQNASHHQGYTIAGWAGRAHSAGLLSWLLFVGAVTFLRMLHPAHLVPCALGQTDGPLLFLLSFHQLQRGLRYLVLQTKGNADFSNGNLHSLAVT